MAGLADRAYNADSINVLEGLEAVRKRPGMYIGGVGAKGLNHLIYELVDNSVDEHLAGYCSRINIILEKDGSCTVSDNGRGVPVEMHKKGLSAARIDFRLFMPEANLTVMSIKQAGDCMESVLRW